MEVERVLATLHHRGASLATAESLTGGRLAALVTGVAGASLVFRGGVVAYATELKVQLLGVPEQVVARHGVVSAECAAAMATGARRLLGATYAVSTTGVAGPDAQEDKRVGTVFVGVAGPEGSRVTALELVGDRAAVQERSCREALAALGSALGGGVPREDPRLR